MKKVLLLSGKMMSGKNQFADFLKEIYNTKGLKVVSDLFAADLKEWSKNDFKPLADVLNTIGQQLISHVESIKNNRKSYGLPDDGVSDTMISTVKKLYLSDENFFENKTDISRSLLQIYGTQIFRNRVDDLYWIKRTKERIEKINADIVLITDVRFPNEIDFISNSESYKPYAIRINRTLNRSGKEHEHISETALDDYKEFAYIVENNSSLSDLKETAYGIIEDIEKEEQCQQV